MLWGKSPTHEIKLHNAFKDMLLWKICFRCLEKKVKMEKLTLRGKWFPSIDYAYSNGMRPSGLMARWARTLALSGTLAYVGCQWVGNDLQYSEGIRTGMINKFSEKGLAWKTYEGQMALEGIVGGRTVGANVWDFSLDRQARHGEKTEELAQKIRTYLESGTKVKVTYVEPLKTWPWRSGTDYLITSVEPVEKK